ncbi:branched-chain amino acid ABC transporter permease [Rhodobacteraceae bacterium B1Z28]|uniref:Branched-chain amino acid ABC transporter permease n=1 Tax=Ruegeria haliotis TaxID=2747601 RepID=A0ABX2PWS1_9RHOB|nr:branched-chain amino acid ABC transporter permease [Ruegeria haliotis]NVO58601.1 branched-chain amino acid ABC transporter permease [Ruegeria haliotis]
MIGYLTAILIFVIISALIGLALNLQWGQAGMVNFGIFGFFAVAAYVAALSAMAGVPALVAALLAVIATVILSALVALVSARLREDYLAIATLAFAEAVRLFLLNETWLTGGANGLPGIPRPLSGVASGLHYELMFLGISVVVLALCFVFAQLLTVSPFGRVLRALREDDLVASTLGKTTLSFRVRAFAAGGAIIGAAGSLHSFYFSYIDPTQFGAFVTAYAFMAVIAGGRGSNTGLLIGAVSVMVLLEGTRFLKDLMPFLDAGQAASLRLILIGVGLILLLIYRPQGFMREYRLQAKDGDVS